MRKSLDCYASSHDGVSSRNLLNPDDYVDRVDALGDKDCTTYLDEGATAALMDWLELRGDHPGPLFHPTVKGGRISSRGMSNQAVLDILR